MQQKQRDLAGLSWEDPRPLSIWLGDSHIEFGDWYNLFGGALAVRNCGMAMATIRDVTDLVKSIPDQRPKTVVIMCGINSIFRGESVEECVKDYEILLNEAHRSLHPQSLVVLAVMPVRINPLDTRSQSINQKVLKFNSMLEMLCQKQGCCFLNIDASIEGADGGLSVHLTDDGLHLNRKGYRAMATAIHPNLPK